jgi:hypothetical protein
MESDLSDDYRTFVFSYPHEGSMWDLDIKARDADDAKARLASLMDATFDGEVMGFVDAHDLREFRFVDSDNEVLTFRPSGDEFYVDVSDGEIAALSPAGAARLRDWLTKALGDG